MKLPIKLQLMTSQHGALPKPMSPWNSNRRSVRPLPILEASHAVSADVHFLLLWICRRFTQTLFPLRAGLELSLELYRGLASAGQSRGDQLGVKVRPSCHDGYPACLRGDLDGHPPEVQGDEDQEAALACFSRLACPG